MMPKHSKQIKLAAVFMAAGLLLSGCSAGSGRNTQNQNTDRGESAATENTAKGSIAWNGEGGCYKMSDPEIHDTAQSICVYGGKLYTVNVEFPDNTVVFHIQLDGQTLYQSSNIDQFAVNDSGIWILSNTTDYTISQNAEYTLIQTDHNGQELSRQDISQYIVQSFPHDMRSDNNGQLYILLENSVIVFSKDGAYLGEISLGARAGRLVLGGDGSIYAAGKSAAPNNESMASSSLGIGSKLLKLDTDAMTAETAADHEGYQVCDGGNDYLYTLLNEEGLYGMSSPQEAAVPIALWEELSLAFSSPRQILWLPGGVFLLDAQSHTAMLTPAQASEVKAKETLTIATVTSWSNVTALAADYNKKGEDYLVKVVDYSRNDTLSETEAMTQLNMDILSGDCPDLIDMTQLPETYYADKGLLEDLYSYIDSDSDIKREDFLLLDKLERDGRLYYAPNIYYLDSAVGLYSRFGDGYGWSLDDYLDIQSQYSGEVMYNITKEGFLTTMVYQYASQAVDWEAGVCDFESEDFLKILNAVSQIRENPEPTDPAELNYTPSGKRLQEGSLIVSVWFIDNITAIAEAREETGEKLSFIGWPTPDGSDGTELNVNNLLGICSKGNTAGAWDFMKYVMTDSAKAQEFGIPVNKTVLEEHISHAMLKTEGEDTTGITVTNEDKEQFYELLEHSVFRGTASKEVIDIVLEEAAPFLAGARTAEETAYIIQSRLSILVAE